MPRGPGDTGHFIQRGATLRDRITMPCNHIMLDNETLSLRKDAAIIQIAALAFDPVTGEHGKSFNAFVWDSTGHVDIRTVAWWMQQSPAAMMGAEISGAGAVSEAYALNVFADFLADCGNVPGGPGIEEMWSHGATFDLVVVENAFNRHGMSKPWSYRIESDTRTLYKRAPGGMPVVATDPARTHDARYDCEVQVKQVVGALAALRTQATLAGPQETVEFSAFDF